MPKTISTAEWTVDSFRVPITKFSDSTILHKHKGITNGNWYNIPVKCNKEFKYLRYIGGRGSFCNINELEFYDSEGTKIEGTIIGTEGEPWARKENVFDNNILTGFSASSPDGNWVGLELKRAMKVSKIKYIGRNDGNGIETGDEYELYYWNSKGFRDDLGKRKRRTMFFSSIKYQPMAFTSSRT